MSNPSRNFRFRHGLSTSEHFGAKGDGITLATEAIQTAIDRLSADGGGHIVFPQGIWLTGPFELKSNIGLHPRTQLGHLLRQTKSCMSTPNPKAAESAPASAHSVSGTSP